jgi:hypothetical protein
LCVDAPTTREAFVLERSKQTEYVFMNEQHIN